VETPSILPHMAQPLHALVTSRLSYIRPSVGFYKALSQEEIASVAVIDLLEALKRDLIDEENIRTYHPIH